MVGILSTMGFRRAVFLDGGSSATIVLGEREILGSEKAVGSALLFGR